MKIIKISLNNFRGVKRLDINLDGNNADIFGANGTGKTTVANAVSWLLTGTPATGEKDFTKSPIMQKCRLRLTTAKEYSQRTFMSAG